MIENIVLKIILSYNTRLIVISFVSQNRQQLRFINRMVCIISTMEGKELFVEISVRRRSIFICRSHELLF